MARWYRGCARRLQIFVTAVRIRLEPWGHSSAVEQMLCKHLVVGSIPIVSILILMKYRLLKDRRRRILHSLFEPRRNILRSIVENINLTPQLRGQAYRALLQRPRDASPTRIRNRCVLTNRPRAIVRRFGLSRLIFRKLALEGFLLGVKKAS